MASNPESGVRNYGRLRWDGGDILHADGIDLNVTKNWIIGPSSDETIALFKGPVLAQFYCDRLNGIAARNFVEIGIKSGGSAIFFSHLLPIEKYVGIELADGAPHFDSYIARTGLKGRLRTYYNTDQADTERLSEILDAEFGDVPIDLVVDDGSHLYAETLASFGVLFPRIRPGGYFILEDWSCDAQFAAAGFGEMPERPLHNLVLDLVMANALCSDFISEMEIYPGIAIIKRGPADANEGFRLKECLISKRPGAHRPAPAANLVGEK
jgi:hypothetical protein